MQSWNTYAICRLSLNVRGTCPHSYRILYTNSFQELDILVLSFVVGALRVQLHMDDVIDFIVDDVMILLYWNTDCHLVQNNKG